MRVMEHHNSEYTTPAMLISVISSFMSIISMKDLQSWVSVMSGMVAIGAGLYAMRNYHLSIQEKKRNLKK